MSTNTTSTLNNTPSYEAFAALFADIPEASKESQLGRTAVIYGLGAVANIAAMCIAFSCSSFWMGFLIYIVVGLLLALLAAAISLALNLYVADEKFEALGTSLGNAYNTVTGWFTSKATV